MTKQETFDLVADHLLAQNAQSVLEGTTECLYRGPNGLKCAVGALIPDDMYTADLEGWYAGFRQVRAILTRLGHDVDLCTDLQGVHDDESPEDWEQALQDIATRHGLTFTPRS